MAMLITSTCCYEQRLRPSDDMAAAVYYSNYDSTRNYGHLEGWLAVGHLILHSSRWSRSVKPWASTFSDGKMANWNFSALGEKGALVSERADTKKITGGMSFPLFREEIFKQAANKSK